MIIFESAWSENKANLASAGRQIYEPHTRIHYFENGEISDEETVNKYGNTEDRWVYDEGEKSVHYVYKNEYDSECRLIRRETWIDDDLDSYSVYDYDGNIRNVKTYDEGGDILGSSKAILNEKGLATEVNFYDGEGNMTDMYMYDYDKYGNATRIVRDCYPTYNSETSFEKEINEIEYTYKKGRPVSYTNKNTIYKNGEKETSYTTCEFVYSWLKRKDYF